MKRKRGSKQRKRLKFCVMGAGHGGLAMAGHLALMGYKVNLYNRTNERIEYVIDRGGIEIEGVVNGFGILNKAISDPEEAIEDTDIIMVVVPAIGHRFMAEQCASYVKDGQIILLNPGRTFGAIEFAHVLREKGCKANVIISEAQTFIYVSRHVEFAKARIFEIKNSVPVAALPAYKTPEVLKVVRQAFPQFVPGTNVLQTSLDNIGAIFHPAITILNAARIEDEHVDFEYYLEGVTPSVARILEQLDKERLKIGSALGIHLHTSREWLYLAYDSLGKTLYDAILATPGYKGVRAPPTLVHRYILEDVPFSLVPMASLGDLLNVPTPTIKAFIHLASLLHGIDYWKEGRTVDKLGLSEMSVKEIRLLAAGGKK